MKKYLAILTLTLTTITSQAGNPEFERRNLEIQLSSLQAQVDELNNRYLTADYEYRQQQAADNSREARQERHDAQIMRYFGIPY